MYLTRETIIKNETSLQSLRVKTSLGLACVTELTAHDWSQYQDLLRKDGELDLINANSNLVCWCLTDREGRRLFDPKNQDDLDLLSRMGSTLINPLFIAAQQVNSSNESPEETKKNS